MTHQDILRDFPLAVELIKAEEGFRATPYKCTSGAWTIGYGTNADAHGLDVSGQTWTRVQAQDALLDELEIIIGELDRRWPSWRELNDARRAVVLSACYQLGIYGVASFKNTIAKMLAEDFSGAADNLLASKWAKQTPERVKRNAEIMRSGVLPQEVNGVQILPAAPAAVAVAAQVQPAPQVLPASGPGMVADQGTGKVPAVRADVSTIGGIVPLLRALSKSKTMGGIVGLLILQFMGADSWDIAIRIHNQIYTIPDLSPYLASIFAALATWGRVTAKPINKEKANA